MGGRGIRALKANVGQECCISIGVADGPNCTVEVYKLEESEEEDTVLVGIGFPEETGRRTAYSFESRKGEK